MFISGFKKKRGNLSTGYVSLARSASMNLSLSQVSGEQERVRSCRPSNKKQLKQSEILGII